MKYTLGFSPCPNDTFIFDALVNKKIDTKNFEFEVVLEDVQTLNRWALQGKLDFSKISYGVLPLVTDNYLLLNSGGALGKGVGPLLISKSVDYELWTMDNKTIAIPGENTTAHMLFSLAYPNAKNKKFLVFNQIEDAVLNEEVDCGVIIHENRFTYQTKGLHKIVDLGEYWEETTKLPIPLGGIVAHKKVDVAISKQVDALIKQSVEYAFQHHYKELADYVKIHAQEMSEAVMRQHIDLYVNNYSIALDEDGKKAVLKLVEVYNRLNNIHIPQQPFFLNN
ncbi:MAG: 1,4-dihydroxy-6-naphthoate synthase [Chitinophaga sp.]|jgi:1,4-dihydroxy-6-naphthoate synthase|nr:1,4-dihydroxy-6-naphthoate synthase [Chitinophaga sp.]